MARYVASTPCSLASASWIAPTAAIAVAAASRVTTAYLALMLPAFRLVSSRPGAQDGAGHRSRRPMSDACG
jgi:hypothetical protein